MTENYRVRYSVDALDDLREIYNYIADELLVPELSLRSAGFSSPNNTAVASTRMAPRRPGVFVCPGQSLRPRCCPSPSTFRPPYLKNLHGGQQDGNHHYNITLKQMVFPVGLFTVIFPPWVSAMAKAMERPIPVPPEWAALDSSMR